MHIKNKLLLQHHIIITCTIFTYLHSEQSFSVSRTEFYGKTATEFRVSNFIINNNNDITVLIGRIFINITHIEHLISHNPNISSRTSSHTNLS